MVRAYNATEYADNIMNTLLAKSEEKINVIKSKYKDVIISYYSAKMDEMNAKIEEYSKRIREEPYMQGVITKYENEINRLREELSKKLKHLDDNYRLYKIIELVGVAEIIADEDYDARNYIERAGIKKVLEYERKRAKSKEDLEKIKDVSILNKGYDIESFDRYIEVKSFKTTGSIELTNNEWIKVNRLKDEYWLYVVEDALGEGKIHTFQNPADRFKDKVRVKEVRDYRYIIDDWRE